MKKNRITLLLVIMLFCTSVFASCTNNLFKTNENKNQNEINESLLNIHRVKEENFSIKISGIGVLVPSKTTSLYFNDVSGPLEKLNIKLYDEVKKGDIIAEILPGSLENSLVQQELSLQKYEINLAQTDRNILKAQKSLVDAQNTYNHTLKLSKSQPTINAEDIKIVETNLKNLQIQLSEAQQNQSLAIKNISEINRQIEERKEKLNNLILNTTNNIQKSQLLKEQLTNPQDQKTYTLDIENLQRNLQTYKDDLAKLLNGTSSYEYSKQAAKARKEQAEQSIEKINNSIANTNITLTKTRRNATEKIEQYQYNLATQLSNVNKIKIDLESLENSKKLQEIDQAIGRLNYNNLIDKIERTKLIAPMDGIVTYVADIFETELISSNKVVSRIANVDDMVLQFTSGDLSYFEKNMKVSVIYNGKSYIAEVFNPRPGELIKEIQGTVQTQLYLTMDEKLDKIEIGEPFEIGIETENKRNVIVIPKSAIRSDGNIFWVEVFKDGQIIQTNIQKGMEGITEVEIIGGLEKGDKVILSY